MKKLRNKILSAVLVLSLLLTSTSFAFAVGEGGTTDYGTKIEPSEISLEGSSRTGSGSATNAFDGNTNTTWESAWSKDGITLDESRFITLDLGTWTYLSHLTFIPRKGKQFNGTPKYLYIYVSNVTAEISGTYNDDNYNWQLAKIVDWTSIGEEVTNWDSVPATVVTELQRDKEIEFNDDISTRYVKIYAPQTYTNGEQTLYITDLTFYENTATSNANVPTITKQPPSAEYVNASEIKKLSVTANNANSYQWYKTEDGTLDSGVVILNANASTYQPTDFGNYFVKVTSADGSYVFSNIAEIKSFEAKVNNDYYVSFKDAVSRALNGSTIEVLKDIELSSPITIDKEITIKSVDNLIRTTQPFTIKRTAGNNNEMFTVATTGNLTLDNIIIDGGAEWGNSTPAENGTNSGKKGGSIIGVSGSGQLTVDSGAILQNNENIVSAGGAIKADSPNAKVHVYGKILNNRTTGSTTNTWNNGGGIATNGNIYIYEGAVISGNNATVKSGAGVGGAIQVYGDGSLNIYGGTIENNKAGSGDNIGHSSSAPINLSGNFNIENINVNTISNKINIVGNVAENSSITIICNSITDGTKVAAIDEGVDTTNIVKAIKVDGKTTYRFGNDVKVGQAAAFTDGGLDETKTVMLNPNGNTSTTLTVETTGTDVTYEWYSCDADGNNAQLLEAQTTNMLTLDNLTIGSRYYYCVIDNGDESKTGPKTSITCEVKVTDFYPCSKAIEKFKSI